MYKRILLSLLITFALSNSAKILRAQSLTTGYGHPSVPFQVGNGSLTMQAKITGGAAACSGGTLTIELPAGYGYAGNARTITYTAGIAGAEVPVTATASTVNTALLPIGSIPASPDSMIVLYDAYAGCEVVGSTTGNASYELSTPGCSVTSSTATTGGLNVQNAQMNISSVSNSSFTGTIGDIYSRVITIQNGGLGYIDTVYVDDISGSGFSISGAVSSSGTLTREAVLSGSDTLYRYRIVAPTSDGHFNQDETITITETVTIVACTGLSSSIKAWYGPGGASCAATEGTATAGANIDLALQPALTIVPNTTIADGCIGETTTQMLKLVNSGNSVMNSLSLDLFSSPLTSTVWTPGTNHAGQSGFDTTSFTYQINSAGVPSSITMDSSRNFNAGVLAADMAGYVGNAFFTIPVSILPGDTVIIYFDEYIAESPDCIGATNKFIPGIRLNYSYKNGCGNLFQTAVGTSVKPFSYFGAQAVPLSDVPSDMWDGEVYFVEYSSIGSAFAGGGGYPTGSEFIYTFSLPSQSVFTGDISSVVGTRYDGLPLPAPTSYTYDMVTNEVTLVYATNGTTITESTLSLATLRLNDITPNCTATGSNTAFGFSVGARQAGCSYIHTAQCQSQPVIVHCEGPCERGGISPTSAVVRRTNYGQPDNDNNGLPDATGSIDFSKVATRNIMHGDTLEYSYSGIVRYDTGSPLNFIAGFVETQFDGGGAIISGLTPIAATISIYDSAGSLIGTQPGLPFTKPTSSTSKIDYSIAQLSSFPSGYIRYNHGDSIVINATYSAQQPVTTFGFNQDFKFTSVNQFYVSDIAAPSASEEKYACDITGGNFTWCGLALIANNVGSSAHTGCDSVSVSGDLFGYVGNDGNNYAERFTHEYRPVYYYDTMKIKIPEHYTFSSGNANFQYPTGQYTYSSAMVPISPVMISGDTLVFSIKEFFAGFGGSWNIPDEGSRIIYQINLKANCNAANGLSNFTMINSLEPATESGFTSLPFSVVPQYSRVSSNTINYAKPSLSLSSPGANITVMSSVADWEIQVANTANVAASNVWLAPKDSIGTVSVSSVSLLSGPGGSIVSTVAPNANGIYELGTFTGLSNKYYRISGTFENCVKDSLLLSAGWGCNGYPAGEDEADCKEEIALRVIPQTAALQLTITDQPSATPVELCDDLNYEVLVKNVALGTASEPVVRILLPSTAGLSYKPGTYQLMTSASGTYTTITDDQVVTNLAGTVLTFNIPAVHLASLAALDTFKIKYSLNTNGSCDFVSGSPIRMTARGTTPCGTTTNATVQTTNPINIEGAALTGLNIYALSSAVEDMLVTDASPAATYRFSLINQGSNSSDTGQSISIEIPAPLSLDLATEVNEHNHTPVPTDISTNAEGNTVYTWALTSGIAPGDSLAFTVNVTGGSDSDTLDCGDLLPIQERVTQKFTATCTSSSFTCTSLQQIASNDGTEIEINRPEYTIPSLDIHHNGSGLFTGNFDLENVNGINATQPGILTLYIDGNGNGSYDDGETLIGSDTVAVTTATTQSFSYSINSLVTGPFTDVVATFTVPYSCSALQTIQDVILPVGLSDLDVVAIGNMAKLTWKTMAEHGNKGFHIERSQNGKKWMDIGFVVSEGINGNSSSAIDYSFIDTKPNLENYYRLRQEDLNGDFAYSNIRFLSFNDVVGAISVYPNPATGIVTVKGEGVQSVSLQDVTGRKIQVELLIKDNVISFDVSELTSGIYTVHIVTANGSSNAIKLTVGQ